MFDIASYFHEICINIYSYKKYNRKKIKRIIIVIPFVKHGIMLCSEIFIDDIFPIMNIDNSDFDDICFGCLPIDVSLFAPVHEYGIP